MSTHCIIAFKKDKAVTMSFCFYDGFPLSTGLTLGKDFGSAKLAEELVNQGNMSCAKLGMSYANKEHCCGKVNLDALAGKSAAEVMQAINDMPLGWTEEMFNKHLKENLPKHCNGARAMKQLTSFAEKNHASYIYLFDEDNCHSWMMLEQSENGKWSSKSLKSAVYDAAKKEGILK